MENNFHFSNYNKNGFVKFENILLKNEKREIEKEIFDFASLFRKKIDVSPSKIIFKIKATKDFDKFCSQLDAYDSDLLWNFVNMVVELPSIKNISTNRVLFDKVANILGVKKNELLSSRPSFLVNLSRNKRIRYHWHNAKNGYPKRNTYLNIWVPLLVDKKKNNGTLGIALKSHSKEYPFLEYKDVLNYKKNALTQRVIPSKLYNKYKKIKLEIKYGDVGGFHPNLIHSTSFNSSNRASFVSVFKIWHIGKDLTLSSKLDQRYFQDDKCAGKDIKIV